MNIDLLIKMTNEIGEFFAGTAEAPEAARAVANHLKRYWEPRMRAQMITYFEQRDGAGLTELARSAVALMVADSKAQAAAGAASRGAKA
jgi:formate dehydrogenase subunit delta